MSVIKRHKKQGESSVALVKLLDSNQSMTEVDGSTQTEVGLGELAVQDSLLAVCRLHFEWLFRKYQPDRVLQSKWNIADLHLSFVKQESGTSVNYLEYLTSILKTVE